MKQQSRENPLVNLTINVLLPSLILIQLSAEDRLGPVYSLILAVALPVLYGTYDAVKRRKVNFFSVMGIVGVLLTGSLGLLKFQSEWIAFKEAAVPLVIGGAIVLSQKTRFPLLRLFLDEILDIPKVDAVFEEKGNKYLFEAQLIKAAYWFGFAFLLSSGLNYFLARFIVVSSPGTPEFTADLGRLNLVTYPVIVLPVFIIISLVLWHLIKSIKEHTEADIDTFFR